jgi:hypothetical protein
MNCYAGLDVSWNSAASVWWMPPDRLFARRSSAVSRRRLPPSSPARTCRSPMSDSKLALSRSGCMPAGPAYIRDPALEPAAHARLVVPVGVAKARFQIRLLAHNDAVADRGGQRQRNDKNSRTAHDDADADVYGESARSVQQTSVTWTKHDIGPTASDLTRFCRHSHPEWLPNAVGSRIPDECTLLDGTDHRLRKGQCGWGFDLLRVSGCYSVRRNQETDSVLKILFRICPVWRGLLHKPCAPPLEETRVEDLKREELHAHSPHPTVGVMTRAGPETIGCPDGHSRPPGRH